MNNHDRWSSNDLQPLRTPTKRVHSNRDGSCVLYRNYRNRICLQHSPVVSEALILESYGEIRLQIDTSRARLSTAQCGKLRSMLYLYLRQFTTPVGTLMGQDAWSPNSEAGLFETNSGTSTRQISPPSLLSIACSKSESGQISPTSPHSPGYYRQKSTSSKHDWIRDFQEWEYRTQAGIHSMPTPPIKSESCSTTGSELPSSSAPPAATPAPMTRFLRRLRKILDWTYLFGGW